MGATENALQGLRSLIADAFLVPGDRLPSEAELGARLGVSRSSIREAIRTLQALGVVETRHGSGTYVSELRAADSIGKLSLTVGLLPLESMLELYELRRVLESHAAALAAARIDDVSAGELANLIDEIEHTPSSGQWGELDHRFHMRIAALAGNSALTALIEVFRDRARAYTMFTTAVAAEIKRVSDLGHRAILTAMVRRDPIESAGAAAAHVAQTEVWLRKNRPHPRSL